LIDLIVHGEITESLKDQQTSYLDYLLTKGLSINQQSTRSRLASFKFVFGADESILVLKNWLKFDLRCGSQLLATYECTEDDTYLILQAAIKSKFGAGPRQ